MRRLLREVLLVVRGDYPVQRDLALLHVYGHLGWRQALIGSERVVHRRGELGVGGRGALLPGAYAPPLGHQEVVVNPRHIPDQTCGLTGALLRVLKSPGGEVDGYFGGAVAGIPDLDND